MWASTRSAQPLRNRGIQATDAFRAGDELPGGVRAFQTPRAAEVVYWLPDRSKPSPSATSAGAGAKPHPTDEPLCLCPERWLGKELTTTVRVHRCSRARPARRARAGRTASRSFETDGGGVAAVIG